MLGVLARHGVRSIVEVSNVAFALLLSVDTQPNTLLALTGNHETKSPFANAYRVLVVSLRHKQFDQAIKANQSSFTNLIRS